MAKIKVLVVEDEVLIADNICDTLSSLGYETLEPAINYSEALETLEAQQPDLALLDIQLSGRKTGIDLAHVISQNYNIPFIFLSSNSDSATVNQAIQVNPNAYLVKPFSKEELYTSIEVALHTHTKKSYSEKSSETILKNDLFIKENGVYIKIGFDEILYLKSSHVYVEIFLKDNTKRVVRTSLNDLILKLNTDFLRVHRGYIVNLNHLSQLDVNVLNIGKAVIPIGKKYKDLLLSKLNVI